jgi:hypothetical protein
MAKELLNHFLDVQGHWQPGQPEHLKAQRSVSLGGRGVRIHETARSGTALLSPAGAPLVAYGDAEVYLKISYARGGFEYLSAPVHTPIDFAGVSDLELNILYVVGNAACASVRYRALFNAHCIFERI